MLTVCVACGMEMCWETLSQLQRVKAEAGKRKREPHANLEQADKRDQTETVRWTSKQVNPGQQPDRQQTDR